MCGAPCRAWHRWKIANLGGRSREPGLVVVLDRVGLGLWCCSVEDVHHSSSRWFGLEGDRRRWSWNGHAEIPQNSFRQRKHACMLPCSARNLHGHCNSRVMSHIRISWRKTDRPQVVGGCEVAGHLLRSEPLLNIRQDTFKIKSGAVCLQCYRHV